MKLSSSSTLFSLFLSTVITTTVPNDTTCSTSEPLITNATVSFYPPVLFATQNHTTRDLPSLEEALQEIFQNNSNEELMKEAEILIMNSTVFLKSLYEVILEAIKDEHYTFLRCMMNPIFISSIQRGDIPVDFQEDEDYYVHWFLAISYKRSAWCDEEVWKNLAGMGDMELQNYKINWNSHLDAIFVANNPDFIEDILNGTLKVSEFSPSYSFLWEGVVRHDADKIATLLLVEEERREAIRHVSKALRFSSLKVFALLKQFLSPGEIMMNMYPLDSWQNLELVDYFREIGCYKMPNILIDKALQEVDLKAITVMARARFLEKSPRFSLFKLLVKHKLFDIIKVIQENADDCYEMYQELLLDAAIEADSVESYEMAKDALDLSTIASRAAHAGALEILKVIRVTEPDVFANFLKGINMVSLHPVVLYWLKDGLNVSLDYESLTLQAIHSNNVDFFDLLSVEEIGNFVSATLLTTALDLGCITIASLLVQKFGLPLNSGILDEYLERKVGWVDFSLSETSSVSIIKVLNWSLCNHTIKPGRQAMLKAIRVSSEILRWTLNHGMILTPEEIHSVFQTRRINIIKVLHGFRQFQPTKDHSNELLLKVDQTSQYDSTIETFEWAIVTSGELPDQESLDAASSNSSPFALMMIIKLFFISDMRMVPSPTIIFAKRMDGWITYVMDRMMNGLLKEYYHEDQLIGKVMKLIAIFHWYIGKNDLYVSNLSILLDSINFETSKHFLWKVFSHTELLPRNDENAIKIRMLTDEDVEMEPLTIPDIFDIPDPDLIGTLDHSLDENIFTPYRIRLYPNNLYSVRYEDNEHSRLFRMEFTQVFKDHK